MMRLHKAFGAALAAFTLTATLFATAAPVGADEWVRCHDETTMYIGQLVDGKCLSPFEIQARSSLGREISSDGSTLAENAASTLHNAGTSQVYESSVQR
jgi:hypothetical protein